MSAYRHTHTHCVILLSLSLSFPNHKMMKIISRGYDEKILKSGKRLVTLEGHISL